jgi:uncharacterized SAM-binding protein YcdF (DUF218 family)
MCAHDRSLLEARRRERAVLSVFRPDAFVQVEDRLRPASSPLPETGGQGPPTRRRRAWPIVLLVVLAGFVAASCALFVWPSVNRPQRADAVVSLDGPGEQARAQEAIKLVEEGYAPVLVFSQGAYYSTQCPRVAHVKVVCFEPRPGRTIGEVEFVARYAKAHGWHKLIVVPGHAQTTRARLLMKRCFTGRIIMVPAPTSWSSLPYDVLYEWGALTKALVWDRSC